MQFSLKRLFVVVTLFAVAVAIVKAAPEGTPIVAASSVVCGSASLVCTWAAVRLLPSTGDGKRNRPRELCRAGFVGLPVLILGVVLGAFCALAAIGTVFLIFSGLVSP